MSSQSFGIRGNFANSGASKAEYTGSVKGSVTRLRTGSFNVFVSKWSETSGGFCS